MLNILNFIVALLGGVGMLKFLLRRVIQSVMVLFGIILGVFLLIRVIPGGPFNSVGGKSRSESQINALKNRYGLDKPLLLNLPNDGISPDVNMETRTLYDGKLPDCAALEQGKSLSDAKIGKTGVEIEQGWALLRLTTEHLVENITIQIEGKPIKVVCDRTRTVLYSDLTRSQFMQYLNNVLRLDFGISLGSATLGESINGYIAERLPPSMYVGVLAAFFGFGIGIPLGVIIAVYRNTWIDYGITTLVTLFASIPSYILGIALLIIFTVQWKVLPTPNVMVWLEPDLFNPEFSRRLVLPILTLVVGIAAGIARLTRASLLQVLDEDYIRTARSKGIRERGVLYLHALKNALIPIATILGPFLAVILTGTFFVERIFDIPGLGSTFLLSINQRDYTMLTGITILFSTFLVIGNIMVDVMYTWLDPRIRFD